MYVMNPAKLNAAVMRWVTELVDYKFKVRYRPGKISQDYDYLFRYPIAETYAKKSF